jgi:hypothetical protein
MTSKEKARMYALCAQIVEEKDPHIFTELLKELNKLLDPKQEVLSIR